MIFKGKVHKVGDHVDTDAIIPARYLVTSDPKVLGEKCMSGLDPEWVKQVEKGDILVAGRNFGCGSSREHAPIAILGAGVDKIKDGDQVEIDSDRGIITDKTNGSTFTCPPLSKTISAIVEKGGLVNYVKSRLLAQAK